MTKRIAALLLAVLLALPLAGCGVTAQNLAKDIKPQTLDTSTDLTSGGTAVTEFALSLLRSEQAGSSGLLLSPISILNALGMVANGAAGDTLLQIETATGMSLSDLNDYLYTYRMSLPAATRSCTAALANSAWIRDDFRVEDDFLRSCVNYYGADIYRSAFDSSLPADLNKWVEQHTDGMIDRLLDESAPDGLALLYLVNAACFEAKWETPYTADQIRTSLPFTAADGRRQTADYLSGTESIYLSGNNVTGFLKPYAGGKYAFVALLPDEGVTLEAYLKNLTGEHLYQLITDHHYAAVQTSIPRFTAQSRLELESALEAMGITDLFGVSADLRGMGSAANDSLYVSSILHQTYFALDENGTKAAAATAVDENGSAQPTDVKTVSLDRPFLYMIVDTHACIPLFMGTVTSME